MEGLARLVNDSLALHGFKPKLDHQRLQWSKWFRCDSSFSVLVAPSMPGIFALGEEVISPGETSAIGGKRMLAVFQISQADDLSIDLAYLFMPGSPFCRRVAERTCFARYAVIHDTSERQQAHIALQHWLDSSSEALPLGF
jgi:hypothetical protein